MKKYGILYTLIFFCGLFGFSQTIYFNKNYDYNNEAEGLTNVIKTDDGGYLCAGQVIATTYRGLYLLKTDEFGDTVWTKLYKKDSIAYYSGYAGSLIKTLDGGYALGGSFIDVTTNNADAIFWKFDSNGDTLWTRIIGGSGRQTFGNCVQNPDGSYILSGDIGQPNRNLYLVKIDSIGYIIWQKNYGGTGDESALSIISTDDMGYILVGYTNSYGAGGYDIYIVKTDSAGNKLWQKTFGGALTDGGGGLCKTLDGNYILQGGLGTSSMDKQAYIVKIDTAGNKIWDKQFGTKQYDTFQGNPVQLSDGSIAFIGFIIDTTPPNNPLGWLMKVSANGDSLWSRTFAKWDGQNYFTDIKQTNDEGFIISGYAGNGLGIGGGQDIWLIKTDSLGCDTAGCFITDIKATVANYNQPFFIYPNPCREYAYIKMNDMFAFGGELRVVDIIGRIIKNFKILYPQQTEVIFSSEIGSGIFLVQYVKDGIIESTQKIIILK